MRVLVLGATGMAGHVIALFLREQGLTVDTLASKGKLDKNTANIDVTDTAAFTTFLGTHSYDYVVNCIGLLVKQSEEDKPRAILINSYLPQFLASYYNKGKTKIIHISSDGVFSGKKPPYTENSLSDAETFYGRTKALGEINSPRNTVFRMSIIGPDMNKGGNGLFNWFFSRSGKISGYTNVQWNGVTTLELAKGILASIQQDATGIHHFVPQEHISKFHLLNLIKEVFERHDVEIQPQQGTSTAVSLTKTESRSKYEIVDYKTMIQEMKDWITTHPQLYMHYTEI